MIWAQYFSFRIFKLKLLIRRIQIYFYKPQRLVVASIVAVCTFFALSFGWIQVSKYAKRKISQAIATTSKKFNMPIDVRKIRVTPGGATLENIVIGADANIVISQMNAGVGLNPFSENFGQLDNLTVHNVKVKAPTENAQAAVSGLHKKSPDNAALKADTLQRLVNRFFASLPTNSLTLKSAGVTLVGEDGKPVFSGKGMKLHVNKTSKKILFRAESFRGPGGIGERNLQGRFQYSPKKGEYQFFAKRKAKPGGSDLWSVTGTANKDLAHVRFDIGLKTVPTFLSPWIRKFAGEPRGVAMTANITLQRTGDDKFSFRSTVRSNGLIIKNPVLSTDEVGHVRFESLANGTLDTETMTADVTTLEVRLPQRTNGKYVRQSPKIQGHLTLALSSRDPLAFRASGQVEVQPTSCQAVIDASPRGLTPNLDEFKLSGTLSIGVSFRMDTEKPEDLFFDTYNTSYTCQVTRAPYSFTKEHLNGAFTLQRYVKGSTDPIEISVSPFSPDYTPIESIAKTVNMALVTSEDNAFFSHKGIDLFALENAVHRNFAEKRIAVGASTITMQTVKNLYLGHERTISRKIQEFFLAWHLEKILDKNRILEIYMNIVEFGPGVYGITNAAQHFFGKHPFDLNLVESAYLASVLPSPVNRYHNFCNNRLSPGFKDLVYGLLKRMVNLNRIPYDRYASALGIQLEFNQNVRTSAWGCSALEDENP
jgi:hypothetical protein